MKNKYEQRIDELERELASVCDKRVEDLLTRLKFISQEIISMTNELYDIEGRLDECINTHAFTSAEENLEEVTKLLGRAELWVEGAKGETALALLHYIDNAENEEDFL